MGLLTIDSESSSFAADVDDDATARDAIVDARSIDRIFVVSIPIRSDDDDRIDRVGRVGRVGRIDIATTRRRDARETSDEDARTKRDARDGHAQGTEER